MANLDGKTSSPALAESALHGHLSHVKDASEHRFGRTNDEAFVEELIAARIRDRLNVDGIKLWLDPFYYALTKSINDNEILAIGSRYSTELELPEGEVLEVIFALQRNAIERLAEREVYKTTGLATIRLRYSGFQSDKSEGTAARIQVSLSQTTGKQLKETIAQLISVHENRLKLICAGRVIDENRLLELQNVKNGGQIMVLSVAGDHETLQQVEDQFRELEETKASANFLANKDGTDGYSLQVADQSGKPLDLPECEKQALAVALALHEKGRASMKSRQFSKSLVFLLEADTVYSQCQSTILDMVDNYGLLNLDIAWCYLSLESIAELPQVETRLKKCEQALKRSYGEDMERVIALKGSTGWEAALYVRLHLLQGIASYHLGQIEKSRFFLSKAEAELKRLTVSDDQLASLINMGYSQDEARMALRTTYGDLTSAVDWIIRKREEKSQIKKQEQDDLKKRKLQKKLGVCADGQAVNLQLYKTLKEMGYSSALIAESLRRTNNEINAAIQLITDPAFVSSVISQAFESSKAQSSKRPSSSSAPAEGAQAGSSNMKSGEVAEALSAAMALLPEEMKNNIQQLVSNPDSAEVVNAIKEALDKTYSEDALGSPTQSREDMEKSQKAFDNLTKDMCSEAEYIDLTLSAETEYVGKYKTLLESI